MNPSRVSEQTRAVLLATDDVNRAIRSFADEVPFMEESRSRRSQRQKEIIANASPDLRALIGKYPMDFIERLARAEWSE